MWLELVVEELRVAGVAGRALQGERDEVSESPARKDVLAWEQAVVGIDTERGTLSHRGGQDREAEPSCLRGWDRVGEEEPDMGAVARSGALDCRVEAKRVTRTRERSHVSAPRAAVQVDGKHPAAVIGEQRVDPDDLAPLKVGEQLAVVERDKRLVGAFAAAHLGLTTDAALPLVRAPR